MGYQIQSSFLARLCWLGSMSGRECIVIVFSYAMPFLQSSRAAFADWLSLS